MTNFMAIAAGVALGFVPGILVGAAMWRLAMTDAMKINEVVFPSGECNCPMCSAERAEMEDGEEWKQK